MFATLEMTRNDSKCLQRSPSSLARSSEGRGGGAGLGGGLSSGVAPVGAARAEEPVTASYVICMQASTAQQACRCLIYEDMRDLQRAPALHLMHTEQARATCQCTCIVCTRLCR